MLDTHQKLGNKVNNNRPVVGEEIRPRLSSTSEREMYALTQWEPIQVYADLESVVAELERNKVALYGCETDTELAFEESPYESNTIIVSSVEDAGGTVYTTERFERVSVHLPHGR